MNECVAVLIKKSEYQGDERSWRYDKEKVDSLIKSGHPFIKAGGCTYVFPKTMPTDELKYLTKVYRLRSKR